VAQLYVIECRDESGRLDFTGPQPENVFGDGAIRGISDDRMAKAIYHCLPDAVMSGESVELWPTLLDPRWTARKKTW
jgi:hypothetical protein